MSDEPARLASLTQLLHHHNAQKKRTPVNDSTFYRLRGGGAGIERRGARGLGSKGRVHAPGGARTCFEPGVT